MLAVNHYSPHYIQECNKRVTRLLEKYKEASLTVTDLKALAAFERELYNCMIILLDAMFINRVQSKTHEETSLQEVRELTASLLNNEDILLRKIRDSRTKVLGLQTGATIHLSEAQFLRLTKSYFAEIQNQFFTKA